MSYKMLLNKCVNPECLRNKKGKKQEQKYTLKEFCPSCNEKTKSAHYKHVKIRDAPKS